MFCSSAEPCVVQATWSMRSLKRELGVDVKMDALDSWWITFMVGSPRGASAMQILTTSFKREA